VYTDRYKRLKVNYMYIFIFIEYATSAGHYKNMCTYRNEKRYKNTLEKKHTHIKTL